MRNLILFCLLVLLLVAAQFGASQTVDEIIAKYIQARGGKDKLIAIYSIHMEGIREMMGNEVIVKVTKEQGKLSRTEFEMGGSNGFILVTDEEAWTFFPMHSSSPSKLSDEAATGLQTELDIAGPLVDYVAKGHKAELLGKDLLDGNECYKIKLTTVSGKEIIYWIDTKTKLLNQSSQKGGSMFGGGHSSSGAGSEIITIYKDYKAVDSILFAHTIETKMPGAEGKANVGETTFDKIELDQPVDLKSYKPESH